MSHDKERQLSLQGPDYFVSAARGAAGALPFIGAALAELVTHVIPNQQAGRAMRFLVELDKKVSHLEKAQVRERMLHPEGEDIMRRGFGAAIQAANPERIEQLAELVAKGLDPKGIEHDRCRLLIDTLNEISDTELIVLMSYTDQHRQDDEWFERHKDIVIPPVPYIGGEREDYDKSVLFKAARSKLLRLNVLKERVTKPRDGKLPEFDYNEGKFKGNQLISPFGRLLLESIGVLAERL